MKKALCTARLALLQIINKGIVTGTRASWNISLISGQPELPLSLSLRTIMVTRRRSRSELGVRQKLIFNFYDANVSSWRSILKLRASSETWCWSSESFLAKENPDFNYRTFTTVFEEYYCIRNITVLSWFEKKGRRYANKMVATESCNQSENPRERRRDAKHDDAASIAFERARASTDGVNEKCSTAAHECQWYVINIPICDDWNTLTVDDRISCGQHASKKLLQTFGSEYFTWNLLFSPSNVKYASTTMSLNWTDVYMQRQEVRATILYFRARSQPIVSIRERED